MIRRLMIRRLTCSQIVISLFCDGDELVMNQRFVALVIQVGPNQSDDGAEDQEQ